jgi:hypothetical protein
MTPPESESFQDVLVHYTSDKGLEGILSSNRLWATHSSHTNDGEELQTWKKLVKRFCETRFWETPQFKNEIFPIELIEKGKGEENGWRTAIERMKEILLKTEEHLQSTKYIFSFSGYEKTEKHIQNNGRLSQWRAYGDYGIVFNKTKFFNTINLKELSTRHSASFLHGPVLYVNVDESIEKGGKIYQWFCGLVITTTLIGVKEIDTLFSNTVLQTLLPEDYKNGEADCHIYYAKITALIKNIGFEEENEYRLTMFNNNIQNRPEKLTIRRHRIVPYIDIFHHDPLPIEKILIGPAPAGEQAERKKMVETLLRHLKKDIPVVCSAIPYRG